jgi:UDP-N-acetylmuramoyl-tripeptide--D-alanyl-D-alanine ligase
MTSTTMMTLAQAHALLPGSVLVGDGTTELGRVHSDTRSLRAGDLFVALKGENFDAHDFLAQARASGAVAALAQRGLQEAGLPGLVVADTQKALTELAQHWRLRFQLPMIAVAGSNGKTTVTQMIASILRAWHGDSAFSTVGNFNNHIGVPLTLLRLRQDDATWHRAGVVELGMNHPGEIAELAAIIAPTVALVNNAQREHQEFMATVEAVAHENGAVISALGPAGVAVFPNDETYSPVWHGLAGHRPTLTFALTGPADVTCPPNGRRCTGPCCCRRLPVRSRCNCRSPVGTTSRTRWPPRPARSPPAARWKRSAAGSRPSRRSRAARRSSAWRVRRATPC